MVDTLGSDVPEALKELLELLRGRPEPSTGTETTIEELAGTNRPLGMFLEPPNGRCYVLTHGINTCLVALSLADQFN